MQIGSQLYTPHINAPNYTLVETSERHLGIHISNKISLEDQTT